MATHPSLIIVTGQNQRITSSDALGVGTGVTALGNTNLTLTPGGTATDVVVASGKNLVPGADNTSGFGTSALRWLSLNATTIVARADNTDTSKTTIGGTTIAGSAALTVSSSGAGALTLTSAVAATWSTTAGVLTLNGTGGIALQGNATPALAVNAAGTAITVQAGAVLGTTGTGNINLPSNGTARFQIEGVAVTNANITAANFDKLFDGSDVGALHTHSGLATSSVIITGLTTTGLADGDFGYISSADTVSKTDAAAVASSLAVGVNTGTAGSMATDGLIAAAKFTTDGGSPSNGAQVFLALAAADTGAGAGKLTATAPTADTQVVAEVGICLNNANYAASKTAKVLLQVKKIVVL